MPPSIETAAPIHELRTEDQPLRTTAHARVAASWAGFVVDGRGVRCVSDRPWVTAAETCELVMALDAIGLHERARTLFEWVQFLRHDDGSYWTGMNFEDDRYDAWGEYFTAEQPTWNSAAVVLAANALGGSGPIVSMRTLIVFVVVAVAGLAGAK